MHKNRQEITHSHRRNIRENAYRIMTIFQCAIKIVTDRSDFLKGIGWKNWVFFKSIYYLIYTKG